MSIALNRHGPIGEITFSHPPHNHLSIDTLLGLSDAVTQLDADPGIRVMILRSTGKVFCAGADLAGDPSLGGMVGSSDDPMLEFYRQAVRLYARNKPMISMIQGPAIGAGLGLAIAADFRVASANARFSANFSRLGFHPGFGISLVLPRLIGQQHANWMCLSSERVKPETALRWGLVDRFGWR